MSRMSDEDDEREVKNEEHNDVKCEDMDTSSMSIQKSSTGGPRRRYHRKNAKNIKVEDPNAPRRPRSAYVHFLSAARSKYGSTKEGAQQREINEKLASEWRSLNEEERQIYVDKSNREKTEYAILIKEYEKTEHFRNFAAEKEVRQQERKCLKGTPSMPSKGKKSSSSNFNWAQPKYKDTSIFSEEFINYNKEQETKLRGIRRQIGQAEDEAISLKKLSQRLEADCDTLKETVDKEEKEAAVLEEVLHSWMSIVKDNVRGCDLPSNNTQLEKWLNELAHHPKKDDFDKVRQSLHNTAFPIPKCCQNL